MTFPESKGQVQTVANQGREGMQRQGRRSHETAQLWGSVLVPQKLKPPINRRCQHSSFQRRPPGARLKEPEKLIKRSPETGLEESRPCTHRTISAMQPLNHCKKNSSPNPPRMRYTASKDKSPLCPFLPGKATKLFFSILPKTLSEIQFSTGKQRLSSQHHMCSKLVEGTRGRRKFPFCSFTRSPRKWRY